MFEFDHAGVPLTRNATLVLQVNSRLQEKRFNPNILRSLRFS
ncbi:hypothetical protein UCMB321_5444 [Pseudomonas batumici]|uniref:Uncharacterized protein n=1 Tax=Pseudomonas batumici TaxID=226910 RepID=A0A0C2E4K5_9PSED|nr:hypothetical protein UCMB321_5444 [Pseudomonas batumici]